MMAEHDDDDTDWEALARLDPTVKMMREARCPMTREHYIDMKYGAPGSEDYPEEWTTEHEDSLPEPFQRRK
jgi:hypothetical protein